MWKVSGEMQFAYRLLLAILSCNEKIMRKYDAAGWGHIPHFFQRFGLDNKPFEEFICNAIIINHI